MKYIINQIMKNVMDSMIKITTKTLEGDIEKYICSTEGHISHILSS